MKQFIKLHDSTTNLPIVVNVNNIACIEREDKKEGKTVMYFINPINTEAGEYTAIFVNEQVEKVYSFIYE